MRASFFRIGGLGAAATPETVYFPLFTVNGSSGALVLSANSLTRREADGAATVGEE